MPRSATSPTRRRPTFSSSATRRNRPPPSASAPAAKATKAPCRWRTSSPRRRGWWLRSRLNFDAEGMRDNSQGYLELRDAYQRDDLYFGMVRICRGSETASIEFGVERAGYLALRRIFEPRP